MRKSKSSSSMSRNILLFVVVVFGIYLFAKNYTHTTNVNETAPKKEQEKPAEAEKPVAKLVDQSLVEIRHSEELTKDADYATFTISYPKFKNASSQFNDKIEEMVKNTILDLSKNKGIPGAKEKYQLDVSFEPVQANNNFISSTLSFAGDSGGAHGYKYSVSFNYDVKKQKEIKLADLFPKDPGYLKTISEFSRRDLTAQFHKKLNIKTKTDEQNFADSVAPMLESGTTPEEVNFSVFTFTPDKITFYFNEYQVAPYAMGESRVTMPRK